jgi:hypothetical protein
MSEELSEEERALYDQALAEIIANEVANGDPEGQAREAGKRALALIHARREQIREKKEE